MNDPTWTADDAPVTEELKKKAPALWKQLCGACGGAAIALGLYAGYQWGGSHVGSLAGYLTPPGWQDSVVPVPPSKREVSENAAMATQLYEMQKVASKAAQMAALTTSSVSSASTSDAPSSAASFAAGAIAVDATSSQSSTSSWSSASTRSVHSGSRWSPPTGRAGAPTEVARADALPDSGLPIVGLIGAAFGVTGVRFKRRTTKS